MLARMYTPARGPVRASRRSNSTPRSPNPSGKSGRTRNMNGTGVPVVASLYSVTES